MILLQSFIVMLKLVVPALMLFKPFQFIWLNYFLDIIDGDLLMALGMKEFTYQTIDKVTDLLSYLWMLMVGVRWPIKRLVIGLFVYRLIGQILFFVTRNELFFFYFQNFLEPFLMLYTLILYQQKSIPKAHATYQKHRLIVWAIVIAYKLWNEWYLHFANIDLSTLIFGLNGGGT